MTYILGLSAYYHDSAAALLSDGEIVAAAQEERFTRQRHDAAFPKNAIAFCLKQANLELRDIDYIVFYDKPFLKFERLLETHLATAPAGLPAFIRAMPIWLKEKLYLKKLLRDSLSALGGCTVKQLPPLLFSTHHQSHAASAFYPSPYENAAVLCLDGVGEWATTSSWLGEGNQLKPLWQINFPHSIGLLYSAFTYYAGFRVNSGEYKLMGLAPYGEPRFADVILKHLIDLKADGSFRLNMRYFNFASGLTMTNNKFHALFGCNPRTPETEITQFYMDIASSIQLVTEKVVLLLARTLQKETAAENLCLAGGVALNCVVNGLLLKENIFKNIWVQPAAGDAGGALGAAYIVWYQYLNQQRNAIGPDCMQGALLGTEYSDEDIEKILRSHNTVFTGYEKNTLFEVVSEYLNSSKVVGWFQGRMEYGPRALGSRSILGDPRSDAMQSVINLKIKNRESFRPFAPAILEGKLTEWFDMAVKSPYMLFVAQVNKTKWLGEALTDNEKRNGKLNGLDKLKQKRTQVPAITHVDFSSRVQTVSEDSNKMFYGLLSEFNKLTQCPIFINTSFNVRGEPIVESPRDAVRCFMATDMDVLVIGSFVLLKNEQPENLAGKIKGEDLAGDQENRLKPDASPKELRQFALVMAILVSLIFGFFIPWLTDTAFNMAVCAGAMLWLAWGLVLPKTLKYIYKGWLRFGAIMSRVTTPLILSIIYFAIITPTGLIMRLVGNDPLSRKIDSSVDSYRIMIEDAEAKSLEPEGLERPF